MLSSGLGKHNLHLPTNATSSKLCIKSILFKNSLNERQNEGILFEIKVGLLQRKRQIKLNSQI